MEPLHRVEQDTVIDDRYRVLHRLGSGGMADVYCADDLQLGRKVALKVLHPRFAEDPDFVERFRREASAAAGLQHPNVVSVYDRGEWDGTYYIAMEFLEGETLKDLIVREAPLDTPRAIPKSVTLARPSSSTMTLWGLMSRCTMPRRWAKRAAFRICSTRSAARTGSRAPCSRTTCLSERPSRNSIAM